MISAGNDRLFKRLCTVLEAPEMFADPRYASNAKRLENVEALSADINAILKRCERAYWVENLRIAGVPAGAVRTPVEAIGSDETRASGIISRIEHRVAGQMDVVGAGVRLSNSPLNAPGSAPILGEHTDEVLADVLGEARG
jgi:CoA:oxalate CoA-transferase